MYLDQRNPPFPHVQIRAVIVNTCVFLVSEVNGEVPRMGMAKQGKTCYENRLDTHIESCHIGLSWVNEQMWIIQ